MSNEERRDKLLRTFKFDRPLAHKLLFAHRHKEDDPAFHADLLQLLYSADPLVALLAFRGAAKSTYLEEFVLLGALFREARFTLIVGPKWESACERLLPIRNELETNEQLIELFGDQKSSPWSSDELVLANGTKIQAIGAGQSMRGKKFIDERPDLAAIDDLEDEESINTKESRRKTDKWLTSTLRPALHPTKGRVRFVGTAVHPESLIVSKSKDPRWKSRIFPIINIDLQTGEEVSAWPSRFPLEWIHKTRDDYIANGNFIEFQQEYMCVAEDVAGKPFQPGMIKIEAAPAVNLPKYAMVDPARTVGQKAARTGYAVWSWLGNKLIVHRAYGKFHRPDEIVAETRAIDTEFSPVHVGVELDGLEEFLMQPLRAEMLLNGAMPIIGEHAPRDKQTFIQGLQPFYIAGNVVHVQHHPDLEAELLQFPTGRIDVPNALAYALRLRAGRVVYEDFTLRHIASVLEPHGKLPRYLVVSARAAMTAGVLLQYADGVLKIYHDWVYNEPPQECFGRMLREAILIGGQVKIAMPQEQFDQYTNFGLPAAVKREQMTAQRVGYAAKSEGSLRGWLQKQIRGEVALLVNQDARWTVNGFSGGYARRLDKGGRLAEQPTDNQYRVVMEALESFVAWFDLHNSTGDMDSQLHYATTDSGKRYISLRPNS